MNIHCRSASCLPINYSIPFTLRSYLLSISFLDILLSSYRPFTSEQKFAGCEVFEKLFVVTYVLYHVDIFPLSLDLDPAGLGYQLISNVC